ncbi:MAG: hypothetical protein VX594_01775 [Actinomycetota bacterium]|nr:hypothetical protein [Actinomycetota bacterium]
MASSYLRTLTKLAILPFVLIIIASCGSSSPTDDLTQESGTTAETTSVVSGEQSTTEVEQPTTSAVEENQATYQISFQNDIMPIIESSCARCHTGIGPGTPHALFETAADVSANAFAVAAVVEAGIMPPWPASDLSVGFLHDWSLSQEDKDLVSDWSRSGGAVDIDPATKVIASEGVNHLVAYEELFPDGNYDGEKGQTDEYRCFIYDPELTERKYLTGYEFVPDQLQVVHHMVGYRVPTELRAAAERKNFSDGQGGWSCFGGTGLGGDQIGTLNQMITVWGPGGGAVQYEEGLGLLMEPGDFFVLQVHYHFDVEAPADNSTFRTQWSSNENIEPVELLLYFAPAEIPCSVNESGPLCDRNASINDRLASYDGEGVQANMVLGLCGYTPEDFAHMTDGIASSTCDQSAGLTGTIVSVLGHQHNIGTSFRMTLNPDTPEERILLDIPKWDFEWQFAYYPTEKIQIKANDVIRLDCTWDRSLRPSNLEPRYVVWADGSDDEMCFAIIMGNRTN